MGVLYEHCECFCESSLLFLMSQRHVSGFRRFFLVIVRTSVGVGAGQSGVSLRCLFRLHPPADVPETAGLFKVKPENTSIY